jgi:hypothetical protein
MCDTEQVKEIGTGPHFVLPKPIADIGLMIPLTRSKR